jgi:hypothetical protein
MKVSLPPSSASPSGFASFFFAPFVLLFFGIAAAPAAAAATPQVGGCVLVRMPAVVAGGIVAWISVISAVSAPRSGAGAKALSEAVRSPRAAAALPQ